MKIARLVQVCVGILWCLIEVHGQNTYDILLAGRSIGTLQVHALEHRNDLQVQRIEAEFGVPLYTGKFMNEGHFQKGVLKNSTSMNFGNNQLKDRTITRATGDQGYEVKFGGANGQGKVGVRLGDPIVFTVTSLYYKEPANVRQIYSERYGQLCDVKRVGNGQYEILFPDKKKSVYTYRQGICQEVIAELAGVKLRFLLKNKG